ncbi:MAG: serine hydrolase domain-containing protein [Solirubrobacteraceae bacterium]
MAAASALAAPASYAKSFTPSPIPITGTALPGMSAWDTAAERVMARQGIAGAALEVAYDGRILLEQGLGYADVATHQLAESGDRFRLASMTKALTAEAITQLIKRHKLTLTTEPFRTVLGRLRAVRGKKPADKRVDDITIKDLMTFYSGWDNTKIGFDPTLTPSKLEPSLRIHTAPTCTQVIEYMLGRRLNYAPGTHYAYANLDYCVLGQVVAEEMHTSYAKAMQRLLFGPLGMTHTTESLNPPSRLLPDEVHYYGQPPYDTGSSSPGRLPLVGVLGAAGVVSTVQDLMRFVVISAGVVPGSRPWYDPEPGDSLQPYPLIPGGDLQWEIDGSLPGTTTSFGQYESDGQEVDYVFLGNSRNPNLTPDNTPFFDVAEAQQSWPSGNLAQPPLP